MHTDYHMNASKSGWTVTKVYFYAYIYTALYLCVFVLIYMYMGRVFFRLQCVHVCGTCVYVYLCVWVEFFFNCGVYICLYINVCVFNNFQTHFAEFREASEQVLVSVYGCIARNELPNMGILSLLLFDIFCITHFLYRGCKKACCYSSKQSCNYILF